MSLDPDHPRDHEVSEVQQDLQSLACITDASCVDQQPMKSKGKGSSQRKKDDVRLSSTSLVELPDRKLFQARKKGGMECAHV